MTEDEFIRQIILDGVKKKTEFEKEISGRGQRQRISYIVRRLHMRFPMPMSTAPTKRNTADCSGITYAAIKKALKKLPI